MLQSATSAYKLFKGLSEIWCFLEDLKTFTTPHSSFSSAIHCILILGQKTKEIKKRKLENSQFEHRIAREREREISFCCWRSSSTCRVSLSTRKTAEQVVLLTRKNRLENNSFISQICIQNTNIMSDLLFPNQLMFTVLFPKSVHHPLHLGFSCLGVCFLLHCLPEGSPNFFAAYKLCFALLVQFHCRVYFEMEYLHFAGLWTSTLLD